MHTLQTVADPGRLAETLIILNPAARGTRARHQVGQLQDLVGEATLVETRGAGEARVVAARAAAEGYSVVVAAGGDGTVNEVVNGLAGTDVTLGVLPIGTMNVFAAELGLPSHLPAAWRVIEEGVPREVDLAAANQQLFVQLAGVGLDAQAVKETTLGMKRSLGPLSYVVAAAHIAARKPPRLHVQADDRTLEGSFVLVGNGRYYGGRLEFFREARIDDGLLDVLVFQKMGHLDIARYVANILVGRHMHLPDVTYFQSENVHVECDEPVPVEVDGELAMDVPVTFRILPRKLKVLVPA